MDAGGPEYDVRVRVIPGTGIFLIFLVVSEKIGTGQSLGTGIRKNWYRKKSRNRHWKNLVPEKSLGAGIDKNWYQSRFLLLNREFFIFAGGFGTGIGIIWYRKKVSESVWVKFGTTKVSVSISEIFGAGKKYRYRLTFCWVPSHTEVDTGGRRVTQVDEGGHRKMQAGEG